MRRSQRPPALEIAVFAAALLLSAFVARELWRRRSPRAAASGAATADGQRPVALNPAKPPLPLAGGVHRTEQAVAGVAPVKLTRASRRKPRREIVPVPK